jgi:hypothetical protein
VINITQGDFRGCDYENRFVAFSKKKRRVKMSIPVIAYIVLMLGYLLLLIHSLMN